MLENLLYDNKRGETLDRILPICGNLFLHIYVLVQRMLL